MIITTEELQNIRNKFADGQDIENMRERAFKLVEAFGKVNELVGLYDKKAEALGEQRDLLIGMIRCFVEVIKEFQVSLESNGVFVPSELKNILASAEEIL